MALKSELIKKAKKFKISRYSRLTKDQLQAAVTKAENGISKPVAKKLTAKPVVKLAKKFKPAFIAVSKNNLKEAEHAIVSARESIRLESLNLYGKNAQFKKLKIDDVMADLKRAYKTIQILKK